MRIYLDFDVLFYDKRDGFWGRFRGDIKRCDEVCEWCEPPNTEEWFEMR